MRRLRMARRPAIGIGHPTADGIAAALAAALGRAMPGGCPAPLVLTPVGLAEGVWWDPLTGVRTDAPWDPGMIHDGGSGRDHLPSD